MAKQYKKPPAVKPDKPSVVRVAFGPKWFDTLTDGRGVALDKPANLVLMQLPDDDGGPVFGLLLTTSQQVKLHE